MYMCDLDPFSKIWSHMYMHIQMYVHTIHMYVCTHVNVMNTSYMYILYSGYLLGTNFNELAYSNFSRGYVSRITEST